jgi:HPt (histidine-containing phosphotransfer) domain-containing protein
MADASNNEATSPKDFSGWNSAQLLERLGGDEALLSEVLDIFLEETPRNMAKLRQAVLQREAKNIETTAHSLKGELGYLGIPTISEKARELEEIGRTHDLQRAAGVFAVIETEISAVLASMRSAKDAEPGKAFASGAGKLD